VSKRGPVAAGLRVLEGRTPAKPARHALLDTHLLLWAALSPHRIPPRAAKAIGLRSRPFRFSVASLWEVAIKTSIGRQDFAVDPVALRQWLLSEGFVEQPIDAIHVLHVASMPLHHRDPFDRLLIAQASIEGLALWTVDEALQPYGRMVHVVK
jgi:PIN domain nuclease of toxin-antitoxin system